MDVHQDIKRIFHENDFDGVDFGCSTGGSIEFAKNSFNAEKMLGIDIDPKKVERTRAKGYFAVQADLTTLPLLDKKVQFSIMSHFLEHLPSVDLAKKCLASAINISQEFIYIQQPYFDADSQLFAKGLKLFWSDWHGHPNRMTMLEFHNILSQFKAKGMIDDFIILGNVRIRSSRDKAIHPLSSEQDQLSWDSKVHPPKPRRSVWFKFPVFHEIKVIIELNNSQIIPSILDRTKWSDVLFDSRNSR